MQYNKNIVQADLQKIYDTIEIVLNTSSLHIPYHKSNDTPLGTSKTHRTLNSYKSMQVSTSPTHLAKLEYIRARPRPIARNFKRARHKVTVPTSINSQSNTLLEVLKYKDREIILLKNSLMEIKDQIGILIEAQNTHHDKTTDNLDLIFNTMGAEFQKIQKCNIDILVQLGQLKELQESEQQEQVNTWLVDNALSIVGLLLQIYTMLPIKI